GSKPLITRPAGAQVSQSDLGLGVKTFTFNTQWLSDLAKDDLKFDLEGDLQPHYFDHEGTLVYSTSPRLSKQMLDAARNKQSLQLPAATSEQQGPLIGYGKFEGKLGATIINDVGVWADAVMKQYKPKPATQ